MTTPLYPTGMALSADLSIREGAESLSRHVERNPGVNATQLVGAIRGGAESDLWRAKRLLLENGYVETYICDDCPGLHHRSLRAYRVETDPDAEPRQSLVQQIESQAEAMAEALVAQGRVEVLLEHGAVSIVDPRTRYDAR